MTTKITKYLSLLAVMAVVIGGGVYATSFENANADDKNKGIGTTEIWEPGPEDGITFESPRPFDANKRSEYRNLEKSSEKYDLSDAELLVNLEKVRESGLPIVYAAIDYNRGVIVIFTPSAESLAFDNKLLDIPYVIVAEDWDPLRNPFTNGPPMQEDEEELDKQSFFDEISNFSILPFAFAVSDNDHGTGIDSDTNDTYDGIYGKIEVHNSGFTLPGDVTIFGGTLMPNSKSSLEIAIRYTDGDYEFTVYDHYASQFTIIEDMDSTWMDTYTYSATSNFIYGEVLENQGTWIAKIYNYDTPGWETLDSQLFDGTRADGWAVWEEYNMTGQCGSITIVQSYIDLVQIRDGSWNYVEDAEGWERNGDIPCQSEEMAIDFYKHRVY